MGGPGRDQATPTRPVLPDQLWRLFRPCPAQGLCGACCSWSQGLEFTLLSGWPCPSPQGSLCQAQMHASELHKVQDLVSLLTYLPKLEPQPGHSTDHDSLGDRGLAQKGDCHFQTIYSHIETNEHVWNLKIHDFLFGENSYFKKTGRASLVAQWLRICLPTQGTWVRALVWEDPTCRRAIKPVRHNYWACALEPTCHNYWACVPQLLKPVHLEPVLRSKRSHRNEKPAHRNKEWPPLTAARESPRAAVKTQCSQK